MMISDTDSVAVMRNKGTPAASSSRIRRFAGWRRRLSALALPVVGFVMAAALVVGVVFAATFGFRWYEDAVVKEPTQTARDEALGGAEQAMLNVLNLDLKDTSGWRKRSESSLTGSARTQLLGQNGLGGVIQQQAGSLDQAATLSAKLVRSAVVEVNADNKTAKAMVFLAVTQSRPGQASSSQTMGFQVEVLKDGGVWKANSVQPLDAIAVDDSGSQGQSQAPTAGSPAPTGGN